MCGVYTAFETEGAIIDELSFVILNQYDHKIKRVLMAWQPLRCRISQEWYLYVMEGYSH